MLHHLLHFEFHVAAIAALDTKTQNSTEIKMWAHWLQKMAPFRRTDYLTNARLSFEICFFRLHIFMFARLVFRWNLCSLSVFSWIVDGEHVWKMANNLWYAYLKFSGKKCFGPFFCSTMCAFTLTQMVFSLSSSLLFSLSPNVWNAHCFLKRFMSQKTYLTNTNWCLYMERFFLYGNIYANSWNHPAEWPVGMYTFG